MVSEGWLVGHGGAPVFHRFAVPDAPRAAVLLLHGYSEHSGRHLATLRDLAEHGFAVFAPDHRGHGRTAQVPGLIRNVNEVLADIGILHRRALERCPGAPVFVLGHSMGGLLALRYSQLHGECLAGLIVNGPAIEVPESIPRTMVALARVVGRLAPRLPVQSFHDPKRGHANAEQHAVDADDPLIYRGRIRAGTGATLYRTIRQTRSDLHRVSTPLLVTAGASDQTVPPSVVQRVHDGVRSSDRTAHLFAGLRHEVYLEHHAPDVRDLWRSWMETRL